MTSPRHLNVVNAARPGSQEAVQIDHLERIMTEQIRRGAAPITESEVENDRGD